VEYTPIHIELCSQGSFPDDSACPAGAIAGLLELLNDRGGRDDLYRIAEELRMEVDDLLPIVEAATLLRVMSRLRPKARHLPKSIFLLVFAVLRRN